MKLKGVAVWGGILGALALFLFFSFQTTMMRGVDVGDPVGELGLTTLQGEPFDLDAWRGKGVMLRFSSTTCTTCPHDLDLLERWQQELGDDVVVAAVQVGDTASSVRASQMGGPSSIPVLLDTQTTAAKRLGLRQVPTVFFITSRGTLSSVSHVEVARTDVVRHVQLMLAGGPTIDADVREVARQIQCQECQGRSAWESDTRSSFAMRERIHELLLAGLRKDEAVERIAEEYGEWLLMVPPTRGTAALAWLLPIGATGVGAGVWLVLLRRARHRQRSAEETSRSKDDLARKKARLADRIDDYM